MPNIVARVLLADVVVVKTSCVGPYFLKVWMSRAHGSLAVEQLPPSDTYFGIAPVSFICLPYRSKKGSNNTTSSFFFKNRVRAKYSACEAPTVTAISLNGSTVRSKCFEYFAAMSSTSGG